MTTNETFARALDDYMKPLQGSFAYKTIFDGHLDISRFRPMMRDVSQYHPLDGATVLSSGCGSAGDLQACRDLGAARVYGIDVDRRRPSWAS